MTLPFTVNANKTVKVIKVGREQTPIIVIDDVLLAPRELAADACQNQCFSRQNSGFYPGARADLPRDYTIEVLQSIYKQVAQIHHIPQHLQLKHQAGYYSLISTPSHALSTLQRIPHFDAVSPFYFALLHYVNSGHHGGTGFFRDNNTGFERITPVRERQYLSSAAHFINNVAQPPAGYITASTEQFTLHSQIDYRPNRLLIYPGNLLHSGLIASDKDINEDPASGRLTANIFIDFV
ncbi:DUF6445 family protein [Paraglaciecola polaris]|uniref:DUF6445 family protein n=1 Tax=Paraglaciecola polaris TaxID=222814 RepID=UPI0030EF8B8D|tara:strand:- start:15307 stop:16017 length:711 start_codon:yes stop_codon:yes gene_type:complete